MSKQTDSPMSFDQQLDAMMADEEGWKKAKAADEAEAIEQGKANLGPDGKPVMVEFLPNE